MAVLREKWWSADSDQKASIKFTVYEIVGLFTGIAISIGLNYNDLINFNSEAKSFFFQYMLGWICGAIIEIILEFIGILTKNFYLLIFICAIRWLMSAFFIIIFVCFLSIWFDGFKWWVTWNWILWHLYLLTFFILGILFWYTHWQLYSVVTKL